MLLLWENDPGERRPRVISVVIVTYESAICVGRCVESVRNALPQAELIVVDNNSRDESLAVVRTAAPEAHLIQIGENVGFGQACNSGVNAATRSHILFVNPDVVITGVSVEALRRLLATRPFGLVAPAFEDEGDRRRAENSWSSEFFAHTFETLRPRGVHRRSPRHRSARAAWVSGGLLLASRDEFLELGGFDPRFFLYYEDRDLSRRYRDANLPIRVTDAIRGRHTAGTSSALDDLRVAPMAWSLLGWIQYVAILEGQETARRAARATLITLRVLRRAVHLPAVLGSARARRKALQLEQLLATLTERAAGDDRRFCPDALEVIRNLT
jgi:N-acetylglucosaminyl-diphospho-decaprenol L-rhamnosyltransferase